MDDIQASVLQGSVTGDVTGSASIIAGRVGGALHLNGVNQNVNFGPYAPECFRTIQACPNGITWALWLKLDGTTHSVILNSGGYWQTSIGYALVRRTDGLVRVLYSNLTHRHRLELPFWQLGNWVHMVLVLQPNVDVGEMYLNGCRVGESVLTYVVLPRAVGVSGYNPFIIGSAETVGIGYTLMTIDNLLIWYDTITSDEVWQLYSQGGEI